MAQMFGSKRADKVPDAFTFTDITGATASTLYESNAITVTGIDAPSPMTIIGGEWQKNGSGAWSSAATTVKKNQTVKVRRTSSPSSSTAVNVTLTIGGISDTYTVTTAGTVDVVPNPFSFTDVANATISTSYESNAIVVAGIDAPATMTVTGGQYQINGGAWASTSTTVVVTDSVKVRGTSSGSASTAVNVVLTIGGVSDTYTITTAADTSPNAFSFTDIADATISTSYESNAIIVAGISSAAPMTITGGEYQINGGAWASSSTTVVATDSVKVRGTSSSSANTAVNVVLTIGGISDTFAITTAPAIPADTTPSAFTFNDVTNATISTSYESNAITVAGINAASQLTVTGGQYQINGGAWASAPTTVLVGNSVKVRGTSSGSVSTAINVVLTIGGVSDTFTVTTAAAADTTPNAFLFNDVTDAALSTSYESNSITVAGINAAATMTVSGGEYQKNGGAWASTATTVVVTDAVKVRATSSGSYETAVNVVLTIGGVSDTFTITTTEDPTPPSGWILATNFWVDSGAWSDTAFWQD